MDEIVLVVVVVVCMVATGHSNKLELNTTETQWEFGAAEGDHETNMWRFTVVLYFCILAASRSSPPGVPGVVAVFRLPCTSRGTQVARKIQTAWRW